MTQEQMIEDIVNTLNRHKEAITEITKAGLIQLDSKDNAASMVNDLSKIIKVLKQMTEDLQVRSDEHSMSIQSLLSRVLDLERKNSRL